MYNISSITNRVPFKHLALLSAAIATFTAVPSVAKTANWQNHPMCYSRTALEAPRFVPKRQVHIIGVGMDSNGELTRYELKPKVYKSMDDLFVFTEQGDFLDNLTTDDFITMQEWFEKKGLKPSASKVSHFDVGSDRDISYVYVLLPRSWIYHDRAFSLKIPPRKNMYPLFDASQTKLTDRAAVIHHKAVPIRDGINCSFQFNLNLDMVSVVAGKKLSTTIIIDPDGGNNPDDPWQGP